MSFDALSQEVIEICMTDIPYPTDEVIEVIKAFITWIFFLVSHNQKVSEQGIKVSYSDAKCVFKNN